MKGNKIASQQSWHRNFINGVFENHRFDDKLHK